MRAFRKLAWVELKLYVREPLVVVFTVGFPALVLFVLGQAFGNETADPDVFRGKVPMDYYVPAYVGLVLAAIGVISVPVHLASYRERGILRRLHASGASMGVIFAAQVTVAFSMALVGAAIVIALGFGFYDVQGPSSPLLFALAFVVSTLTFAAIGFVIGAATKTARAAQGIGLMLFFVMMFLSGTDGPLEVFGTAMQRFADVLPLTHVVRFLQDAWYGNGISLGSSVTTIGIGAGAGVISLRAGFRARRPSRAPSDTEPRVPLTR